MAQDIVGMKGMFYPCVWAEVLACTCRGLYLPEVQMPEALLISISALSWQHMADTIQARRSWNSDQPRPHILWASQVGLKYWFLSQNYRNLEQAEQRSTFWYLGLLGICTTDIVRSPQLHPGDGVGISHKSNVVCPVFSLVISLASDL